MFRTSHNLGFANAFSRSANRCYVVQKKSENSGVFNQLMSRLKGEWGDHVTRMGAERLFKIIRDNIAAERSPGCPKRRWRKSLVKHLESPIK